MADLHKSHINGKITEFEAISYFLDQGYKVYTPVIDNGCDLLIEKYDIFMRVQVKYCSTQSGGTKHIKSDGTSIEYISHRNYTARIGDKNDVDIMYFDTPIGLYIVPIKEIKSNTLAIQADGVGKYSSFKIG